MTNEWNPQAMEMADESMVRNLAAQAEAIWPQEQRLFDRYGLPAEANMLDAGCGTGEISLRLAETYPRAHLFGVDVIGDHLARARVSCAGFGERVRFENRSVFELGLPNATVDLVAGMGLCTKKPEVGFPPQSEIRSRRYATANKDVQSRTAILLF